MSIKNISINSNRLNYPPCFDIDQKKTHSTDHRIADPVNRNESCSAQAGRFVYLKRVEAVWFGSDAILSPQHGFETMFITERFYQPIADRRLRK
jgi:hypothetical protein